MPEAQAFGFPWSAPAVCHRCARLALLCPQFQLVWRRASETQAILSGCEPDQERGSSLHPVVESPRSRQQGYSVHGEDKSGKVEAENEREGSAARVGQGYDPHLGGYVRQDTSSRGSANQSESDGDQNAQLLLKPRMSLASTFPTVAT